MTFQPPHHPAKQTEYVTTAEWLNVPSQLSTLFFLFFSPLIHTCLKFALFKKLSSSTLYREKTRRSRQMKGITQGHKSHFGAELAASFLLQHKPEWRAMYDTTRK